MACSIKRNLRIVGHTFTPFDDNDWEIFAGAAEGSYICYLEDDTTLIWDPAAEQLSEMTYDESGNCVQRDYLRT